MCSTITNELTSAQDDLQNILTEKLFSDLQQPPAKTFLEKGILGEELLSHE